jgi:hypothetical protein
MSEETYYTQQEGKVVQIVVADQRWRVEVMYDCYLHPVLEYDGSSYDEMCACIGGLCLSMTVDRIIIYRNGEQHRRIELR